ncbi:MAG: DUF4214 domain-containing protein [Lachnospiraceae bacterium]|nr:DUF4214 domain-containing protein [Lachnospiraceae bacterium]
MKTGKRVYERILSLSLCTVLVAMMVFSLPVTADAKNGTTGSADLGVEYHTKTEIAHFIIEHPANNAYNNSFDSIPGITAPYSLGKVSDSTLNDSLALLNTFRYIAGLPANVTLNSEYNELAQAASVVNAANNLMTHYPEKPAGMDDALYQKGYEGASHSNIAYGWTSWDAGNYFNIGKFMNTGWMGDSDSHNLDRVGHRRWILNPPMGQTGFGLAKNGYSLHSSMYAFDSSNTAAESIKVVAWPGQNTPVGYFDASDAWSVSMGDKVNSATVKLTCENTGKTWTFIGTPDCNKSTDEGYININNDYYGLPGCIIFRPQNGTTTDKGYSYKVSITGTTSIKDWVQHGYYLYYEDVGEKTFTVNYTVDFFDINDYKDLPVEQPLTDEQKAQVEAFVRRFYKEVLGRPQEQIDADTTGIANWTNSLIDGSKTGGDVAYGFVRSTEFTNRDLNNADFLKTMYKAFFNRDPDEGGYNGWYDQLQSGQVSRDQVVAGFVNSGEFQTLCSNYGITPGKLNVPANTQPANTLKPLNVDTSNVDPDQLDAFVERLYDKALVRPSDAEGKAYWKGCILNGKDNQGREYDIRTVISIGFLNSKEYKNRDRNNAEFVLDCYAAFFDRSPIGHEDEPNYWDWVKQLNEGSITRQQMIERGFGDSQEFRNLISSYGFVIK